MILGMFQIAYIPFSSIIGANLVYIGRKRSIVVGYVFITLTCLCLGLLSLIKSDGWFFGIALVIRFLHGIADASVIVAVYSIIAFKFPNKREQYIGFVSGAMGLGMTIGPLLGSLIYG